jgi:catechol 2,3-dioxygenase-like lactoylglutathione lyase family enzyme
VLADKPITANGEQNVMSNQWFARPVLLVADIDRSVDFYVKQLGFTQAWRYEEEGKAWVAQVDRQGCELILSSQWPDKVGKGLMFISLDADVLDALRAELEGRGVDVKDGQMGLPAHGHRGPGRQRALLPLSDVACHRLPHHVKPRASS